MKLHGLARVKNEGDVVEEFVRHNLEYLDALTVVDNASLDGTLSVLQALREEGLPVTILHDSTVPKWQHRIMTQLARQMAAERDWDYLFLLDADEFLKVADRGVLEKSLSALSPGENGLLPLLTYVPTAHDPADEPRLLGRIRHRRAVEADPPFYKVVVSRDFATGGEFTISQGNHAVHDVDGEAPAAVMAEAALAHFPVRSLTQIQGKALLGWGAYLAMGYGAGDWGWHQRRLFDRLESTPTWTVDDLYAIALRYSDEGTSLDEIPLAFDPLVPVQVWRHADVSIQSPMQIAARYVRQLAGALARCEAATGGKLLHPDVREKFEREDEQLGPATKEKKP